MLIPELICLWHIKAKWFEIHLGKVFRNNDMTVLPDFWPSQTSQQRDGLPMVAQASLWQSSNQDGSIYDPFPTPGIHHQRFSWRFRAPCRPSRQFSFPGNPHLYLSIQQSTLGLFFWFWAGIYHILHAPTKKYHSITCKSNMINQYLTTNKLTFLKNKS